MPWRYVGGEYLIPSGSLVRKGEGLRWDEKYSYKKRNIDIGLKWKKKEEKRNEEEEYHRHHHTSQP